VEFDIGGPLGAPLDTMPGELRDLCGAAGVNLADVAAAAADRAAVGAPSLGVTITPKFHLGLTRYTRGGQTFMRYSNAAVDQECYLALSDELDNINAATKINNSFWYGLAPFSIGIFNSTFGLLGFASFLQILVYFGFVCIAYDAPFVSTHPRTSLAIRALSGLAAFFAFVPLVYFANSGIKNSFCNAFDPDTRFNGTFCGYQTGFNIAIAATVFAVVQTLLLFVWLPKDFTAGGKYEFSDAKAGYANVGAPAPAADAAAPIATGSYQDFGSPSA
jgi:hypothetical protein